MLPLLIGTLLLGLPPDPLIPLGQVRHPDAAELSGLAASRQYPGVFWTLPDSGHPPILFAIRRDGTVLARLSVNALNLDWEAIATDDSGHLIIADTGNNTRLLPVRTLHVLDEPDPHTPPPNPLPVLDSISYRYPPGKAFDAEALVILHNQALLISKTPPPQPAEIYTIPLKKPPSKLPISLTPAGPLLHFPEPVTAADLSPDGRLLAVSSLSVTRLYRPDPQSGWQLVKTIRYPAHEFEALAWDGPNLLLLDEPGHLFHLPASALSFQPANPP